ISTKPGERGAGETETEVDEPPKHLPTTRTNVPLTHPHSFVPPSTLQQRITPLLFEFSRLLSIVPALVGLVWNLGCFWWWDGGGGRKMPPDRMDYFVSALWALLTGYQCLSLTTGLLTRWRLYYPPLATLIRLLALQAICWPATWYTLRVLDVGTRPALTWAVVGTTTCASKSVQIWVTSNLWWERGEGGSKKRWGFGSGPSSSSSSSGKTSSTDWYRFKGGKWGGRRWNWDEMMWKCVLPAGAVYTVMAWAGEVRREW
ncbi:hypothetical protein K435DRAFT_598456, partial [Dendrothele bispora CBS 962.96]